MGFTPPKSDHFKRFIAIDTASVSAALAALDGGAVSEVLTRTTDGGDSGLGGELGVRGAKVSARRSKERKVEEELRRVRTEHSAASSLVDRLRDAEAVGEVDGGLEDVITDDLGVGMVIHFVADVVLHPLHQTAVMADEFIVQAPKLGVKDGVNDAKDLAKFLKAVLGSDRMDAKIAVDFTGVPDSEVRWTGGFPMSGLQVPLEDLQGRVHVLAQVDAVHMDGERVHALRLVRGVPPSETETTATETFAESFGKAVADLGIRLDRDDIMMPPPMVILRILCLWR